MTGSAPANCPAVWQLTARLIALLALGVVGYRAFAAANQFGKPPKVDKVQAAWTKLSQLPAEDWVAVSQQSRGQQGDPPQTIPARNVVDQRFHLFLGSSTINRWDLADCYPGLPTRRRGVDGAHLSHAMTWMEHVAGSGLPATIVVYGGDNDIADGVPPGTVAANFAQLCQTAHARWPEVCVVYLSIKPSRARWPLWSRQQAANLQIAEFCRRQAGTKFLALWPNLLGADGLPRLEYYELDRLHLNAAGYKLWSQQITPLLEP